MRLIGPAPRPRNCNGEHMSTIDEAELKAMLARGIYLPPSQFEAWFLSGAHTKRDAEKTVKAAREAMKEIGR